ncbi:hypothetical protein GCM10028824_43560 [Hymenobacter segetis]|uniref:Uncharacterized protein n=1 Tax=Hymenobacter segetis TaxID=2025509 RepID=A0ABU9LUA7_9BACT
MRSIICEDCLVGWSIMDSQLAKVWQFLAILQLAGADGYPRQSSEVEADEGFRVMD